VLIKGNTLKDGGTCPVSKYILLISSREVLIKGEASLSSLVGMESKRRVEGLEVEMVPLLTPPLPPALLPFYTSSIGC